jgi:hypothetical protein
MPLTSAQHLALALDPALCFTFRGLEADRWQCELLRSSAARILLNCSRQAGKSTVVAALALHTALFSSGSLVLLLSKAQRQSCELFRKVMDFYWHLGEIVPAARSSLLSLELANGSRIVSLPGNEANIRSFSGVRLLIIDEAARVPDALYKAVRPMLAVSRGRLICLSTPFGQRGFFHEAWRAGSPHWLRFEIPAQQVSRISPAFLDEELRTLGRSWFDQEYGCSFQALEGLVYPDWRQCEVERCPADLAGRAVGGIDFGFHNPFAAVWGFLDGADVLWITTEHYQQQWPLHRNAARLPRSVRWYADPAGANEIEELRCANYVVSRGDNSLRAGIAAVTARIQTGRLKVVRPGCPNLVREAGLYRYPSEQERAGGDENPLDENNHALAALRYLISRLDSRFMVKFRKRPDAGTDRAALTTAPERGETSHAAGARQVPGGWLDPRNEVLWKPLYR